MRILWFRRDLRVEDNPLLSISGEVLPIFIFDVTILEKLEPNDKRVSFIFDTVMSLKRKLKESGLDLAVFFAKPKDVFLYLNRFSPQEVIASGDYDFYAINRDIDISHILPFRYLYDTYIFEPDEVVKSDGSPYLVFTPFYNQAKKIFSQKHLRYYEQAENSLFDFDYAKLIHVTDQNIIRTQLSIESFGFKRNVYEITPVEALMERLKAKLDSYEKERDYLQKDATSHLSVHLRFGTLGIRELLRFLVTCKKEGVETEAFFRQLVFRDFYAYLLFHFPDLEWENFRYPFKGIEDEEKYKVFCEARTGVPIIDAGVRELLAAGNMHNRVRMICASFFTKDLLLPWQWGEKFFAKHLFDYDAASNILSWQWSSGTGVDPQPYFRIFNPYLQAKKFDKDAVYVKRWVKELAEIDAKSTYDESSLLRSGLKGYLRPIVEHKLAADEAKKYFAKSLKGH